MKTMTIVPCGWPCTLEECPPGPFVSVQYPDALCMKSEYFNPPDYKKVMAFTQSGEFYCGEGLVQPVDVVIGDE